MRVMETTPPDRRTVTHSSLSASQRSQRAAIAAHTKWSKADRTEGTSAARAAFLERFEREVDPDGVLDPVTRAQRAESAKRAHFQRMAYARHRRTA